MRVMPAPTTPACIVRTRAPCGSNTASSVQAGYGSDSSTVVPVPLGFGNGRPRRNSEGEAEGLTATISLHMRYDPPPRVRSRAPFAPLVKVWPRSPCRRPFGPIGGPWATNGLSLDTATLRITLELVVSKAPKSALPRCVYVKLPSLFRTAVPKVNAGDARLSVLALSQ